MKLAYKWSYQEKHKHHIATYIVYTSALLIGGYGGDEINKITAAVKLGEE